MLTMFLSMHFYVISIHLMTLVKWRHLVFIQVSVLDLTKAEFLCEKEQNRILNLGL